MMFAFATQVASGSGSSLPRSAVGAGRNVLTRATADGVSTRRLSMVTHAQVRQRKRYEPCGSLQRLELAPMRTGIQTSLLRPPLRAFSTGRALLEAGKEPATAAAQQGQTLGKIDDPKLSLTFTCTVTDCGHRSTHQFAKRSYERGIVLVQCPGCKNRHLIADHLGWFKDTEGAGRTVEEIVQKHGGRVRRGIQHGESGEGSAEDYETIEILSDTHASEVDADSSSKQ